MDENNELNNEEIIEEENTETNPVSEETPVDTPIEDNPSEPGETKSSIGDNIDGAENIETGVNEDNNNIIFKCEFAETPVEQYKYAEIMYGKVVSIHRHFMPLDLFKKLFVPEREADFIDILPAELASGIEVQVGDYVFHDGNGTLRIERPIYDDSVSGISLRKIDELKKCRDDEEVAIIVVNDYPFDYDSKARERINAAIISLDVMDSMTGTTNTIEWTLADNTNTDVTATFLRMVVAKVAERSNILHIKYRDLKSEVNTIVDNDELTDEEKIELIENISWNEPVEEPEPEEPETPEPTLDPEDPDEDEPSSEPETPTPEPSVDPEEPTENPGGAGDNNDEPNPEEPEPED